MAGNLEPRVLKPGSGKRLAVFKVRFRYRIEGPESGGALAALEVTIPPGTLVKPHSHSREDEFSMVLRGTVGVRLGDRDFEAEAGSYLVKPRGIPHAMWNAGEEPVTVVEIVTPAGLERYFEQLAPVLRQSGPDATSRFAELAKEYGLTIMSEWTEELESRYNVRL